MNVRNFASAAALALATSMGCSKPEIKTEPLPLESVAQALIDEQRETGAKCREMLQNGPIGGDGCQLITKSNNGEFVGFKVGQKQFDFFGEDRTNRVLLTIKPTLPNQPSGVINLQSNDGNCIIAEGLEGPDTCGMRVTRSSFIPDKYCSQAFKVADGQIGIIPPQ